MIPKTGVQRQRKHRLIPTSLPMSSALRVSARSLGFLMDYVITVSLTDVKMSTVGRVIKETIIYFRSTFTKRFMYFRRLVEIHQSQSTTEPTMVPWFNPGTTMVHLPWYHHGCITVVASW